MATSGKIQGATKNSSGSDVTSRYGTWIEWKRNSNSIANNTSNITVTVYVQRIDSYSGETAWNLEDKPSVSLKVGGVAKNPTVNYIDTRNHKLCTVATWTGDVGHTADGSLSLALSCGWTLGLTSLYSGSISGTAVLDTIPRASTFGTVSGTTIGGTMTVNITRAVSTFTHQLWYKVGNSAWYDLGKNIGTSKAFTIDIATANQFPNATSGNLQLCLRTFNGTTQIGSDVYKDVTVSVPNYSPTISNIALTGNNLLSGAYVQGKSTVTAEITASTMYGATIKSFSATVDGKTYTGNKFTSSALSNGSKTVSVTVTDTRGKTATLSSSAFTVYAYAVPSITEFTVVRQADGTTVIATVKGSVAAINNKNAKTVTVTLNGVTKTITSSSYTINGTTTFTNVPTDNTLTATAKIQDSYTYDAKDTILPTVAVTMDFHHSGKGVAFGKVAETEGLLDVAWDTNIKRNLNVDGVLTLGGVELNGNDLLNLSNTDSYGGKNTFIYNSQTVANSYGNTLSGASINLAANSTYLVLVGVIASDGAQTAYSDILLAGVETGGELLINCPGRGGAYAGGGVCGFAIVKTTSATFARCQSHGYKNASFNLYMRIVAIKLDT
jgi:hypothetical protein